MTSRIRLSQFATVLCLLLSTVVSLATVKIDSVSGVSESTIDSAIVLYAGTAGPICAIENGGTCNNCGSTRTACNTRRVIGSTNLRVHLKSDKTGGRVIMTKADKTTLIATGDTITKDTVGEVEILWSTLCAQIEDSTDCTCDDNILGEVACTTDDVDVNQTITVGVDADSNNSLNDANDDSISSAIVIQKSMGDEHSSCSPPETGEGFCQFSVFPGDEKVYVDDLVAPDGCPNSTNGMQYKKLRFYLAPESEVGTCNSLMPDNGNIAELGIGEDCNSVTKNKLTGLQNDVNYCFIMATVDKANNIGYFTPDGQEQQGKPGKVLGLLSDNIKCFITTAAYGTPFSEKVETFRQFRDHFLVTNHIGETVIKYYEQYSPPLARFILRHDSVRTLARVMLWPMWVFAWLSLQTNPLFASLILVFASMLLGGTLLWVRKKALSKASV